MIKKFNLIFIFALVFIIGNFFNCNYVYGVQVLYLKVSSTNNLTDVNNVNLETLAIENYLLYPEFASNITEYEVEVSNKISKLNILAVPENEDSKVTITNNEELKEGDNIIKVYITDKDNLAQKVYQINVKKRTALEEQKYENEKKENNEKLQKIYQTKKLSVDLNSFEEPENESIQNIENASNNVLMKIIVLLILIGICFVIII